MASLASGAGEPASAYLLGIGPGAAGVARLPGDPRLAAQTGLCQRRAACQARRFMRGKYPELADRPLALLHLKRMVDLVRPRPSRERRR